MRVCLTRYMSRVIVEMVYKEYLMRVQELFSW